jgi:hypothetical protein
MQKWNRKPAGLAVPFLLVALGTSQFVSLYQRWRTRLVWVERFAGLLLITVGVLVFFDVFQELSYHLSFFQPIRTAISAFGRPSCVAPPVVVPIRH